MISIISEKINYSEGKALAARWTGSIYREQGELNLAKEHFKKALKLYEEINNYKGIVKLNNILGDYYYNMSDFTISLEHYIKALNINEFKKDMDGLSISYNNIGRIYYSQENYDMALRYYAKSIEIKKAFHHKASLANTYNNVARTYLKMLRYDSAYYYFDQAWIIYNLTGEKVGEADSHMSIGNVQYETGDYLSAIISQNKALSIYETNGDLLRIAICQLALGKAFFKLHDLKKAETYFNKALAGSIKYKLKKTAMEVYLNLAHLKDAEAEYKLALGYYKLYSEMKDSIFKEETRNKIIEINERYENTKKDKAIAELNQEKSRIIAENNLKTIERENRTKILFTIMLSLSIMLLIFYRFLNIKQQKERQKEFTMQLIESQEDERKRISKDLHDGIGQNLLVIKNSCKEQLPLIESTIEDLRNISRNMHPVQLEKLGFIKATESVIVEAKQNSTILFTYELDDVDAMLTPSRKINLFRIIQECISNIIKHSGTSAAKISVLISKNNIVTSIYDKGKGFDIKETKKRKSLGLTSIAERVELMDGKLNISSNSKGTRIEIILKHA
ncbi:MAG: sensor histidine kinase [Bacteroidetes bacterium]|nr:sensor histidine kinase [Bacteroidota bacterium]